MTAALLQLWKKVSGQDFDKKSFHSNIIMEINQILSHLAARNQAKDQFDTITNAIQKYGSHIRQATTDAITKHGNSKAKAAAKFTDALFKGMNIFNILKECVEIYQYIACSCNEASKLVEKYSKSIGNKSNSNSISKEEKHLVKEEMNHFADEYSDEIINVISNEITLIINGTIKQKSLGNVNKFVQSKVTKKFHNEGYFRGKQYKFKQDSINEKKHSKKFNLLKEEMEENKQKIIKNKEGKPADELDVKCLGEKMGVNINIVTLDAKGKKIGEDLSNNNSKDTIYLQRSLNKDNKGHYEAIINGKVVENDGDNNQCLYQAVAQIEASKKGSNVHGSELKERATFLKKEALSQKDPAILLKMQHQKDQYTAEVKAEEKRHGVTGLLGVHDLSGGDVRKPVLKGSKKQMSRREFSTKSKKGYAEAHTDHYTDRLKSVTEVHRLYKEAFNDGVKFEDVLHQKATHQDNEGWKDSSKKTNDFASPVEELANVHAGHVVGLGFKNGVETKIKDQQAFEDLKILLAKTNPVSKESNQQIERTIDMNIYNVLKKNQHKKVLDIQETSRYITKAVLETNNTQQSMRTGTNNKYAAGREFIQKSWKIHTDLFLQSNKNIESTK